MSELENDGFYWEPDQMQPNDTVFYFPFKSPEGAVTRASVSALTQLDLWKKYQSWWCDHKPSVTGSVKENEGRAGGAWVYDNFECISGVSFLPFADHVYAQAPFQDCDEETYRRYLEKTPKTVDWSLLTSYETSDTTVGSQELSCSAGSCDIR